MVTTPLSIRSDSDFAHLFEGLPRISRWLLPVASILIRGTESSTVEPRVRALVVLRMAAMDNSPYWEEQSDHARSIGISPAELDAITGDDWQELDTLSDRENAALQWTTSVATNDAKRDPHSFAALEENFNASEIVELTAVAAMCASMDRLANAFQLEPEDPFDADHSSPVTEDVLATWAETMFETSKKKT